MTPYIYMLAICLLCRLCSLWYMHMCAQVHESHDIMESFLIAHHRIVYCGRVSHVDSGLADMAGLPRQLALEVLSLPAEAKIAGGPPYLPGIHMGSEDPNSSSYTCVASALTIGLSLHDPTLPAYCLYYRVPEGSDSTADIPVTLLTSMVSPPSTL